MNEDRLDRLEVKVDAGFARMDDRFAAMDDRFATMDDRFATMDQRFATVDARFDAIDVRFDAVDARFDRGESEFARLELTVARGFAEVRKEWREGLAAAVGKLEGSIQRIADGQASLRAEIQRGFANLGATPPVRRTCDRKPRRSRSS